MRNETDAVVGRRALLGGAAALSVLVAAGALAACGKKKQKADGPVEVEPGDTCARCGMHIADMRHVGEIIGTEEVWKFDDVGELFVYHQEQGLTDGDVQAIYVKGYDTGKWIEAGSASFVIAPDVKTPMATHVLALGKEDSVTTYTASAGARETTYDELVASPPEASMDMGSGGMESGGMESGGMGGMGGMETPGSASTAP